MKRGDTVKFIGVGKGARSEEREGKVCTARVLDVEGTDCIVRITHVDEKPFKSMFSSSIIQISSVIK